MSKPITTNKWLDKLSDKFLEGMSNQQTAPTTWSYTKEAILKDGIRAALQCKENYDEFGNPLLHLSSDAISILEEVLEEVK